MSDAAFNPQNPCLTCGACCATFRVSFYWSEAEVLGLTDRMIEQISPWHGCMAGTNQVTPRCHALQGEVGEEVSCGIYLQRPSPCHELQPGEDRCNRARAKHGLLAIAAGSMQTVGEFRHDNVLNAAQFDLAVSQPADAVPVVAMTPTDPFLDLPQMS